MKDDFEDEDEEKLTLENARRIFIERQRAAEELARTKDELWQQSEWLRVTLASIGDGVVTTDLEGRVVSLNGAAQRLLGWSEDDARGRPLTEVFRLVQEDTRQPVENPVARALREGRPVDLTNHAIVVARDGTETPIDDSAAPIRDEAGNTHGVVLIFRSIADRMRAEDALRRRERELSDFFENASVGCHWAGPDGVILRVNRAELDLLGYTSEEYLGHHVGEFHVDREIIDQVLAQLAAGEAIRDCEARMRAKDGSIKHVLIDASVLWDEGRFVHTRSFTRDITDRRHVAEIQAQLAAIVESSEDAIVSKTLDRRIVSWNAGAERLFGYTRDEAIGQPITFIIPPERLAEEETILERLHRGERIEHYETVRQTKDGRHIDVSLTISPVRDSSGRIVGASKIARDITAKKRAGKRLLAHNRVTTALAERPTLRAAARAILDGLCECLDWDVGALWRTEDGVLRSIHVHCREGVEAPRFVASSDDKVCERGRDLPGRVCASGEPAWIRDIVEAGDFLRADAAAADGLRSAVAFPLKVRDRVLGVIELCGREAHPPDRDVLDLLAVLGEQIGQFIERESAQAALRESEARFRTLAATVPSVIWTAAPDGTITYANQQWFDYCGLSPEDNARRWPELVLHPDDRERCMAEWTAALEQGTPYEIEVRNRRHDGVYRWFVTRAVPLLDASGQVAQWVGSSSDIEDRKRTEQTTRFLADASAALAMVMDLESTLQKVASLAVPHFADWCAVDVLDLDGSLRRLAVAHVDPEKIQHAYDVQRRFPARESNERGARQVVRTGQRQWAASIPEDWITAAAQSDEHLRLIRELGLRSYISVPLKSRAQVHGAITFVMAESGRTYDENDVRAAEDLASRAVIAIENANLLAALKDAGRRKDEFLAMLAHELRNPLAPIRNAAHIFRAKAPPGAELQWASDVIDRQVHQMTRLIDDLLDVSRITRGKIELRKEPVELGRVMESAVEACRPLIETWGHRLTVTIPPQPIRLHADPTRLAQVLSNLLNNSAKYTNQGGHIALSAELAGEQVVIRVTDNGIGIPETMLPHIFEMFTQVERSAERSEGGLGIGLTLVQRLVALHGGSVAARSAGPGKGSEFEVRLPVAKSERRERAVPGGEAERAATIARRILVVDDNKDAADSLGMLLRMLGNEVQTAHDGLEALGAAATFKPHVVLLDIGLPKLDGYQVARRIREQPDGRSVLLIALTGWGQQDDRRRAKEAGFDHHLTKPVEFKVLQKLLAETDHPER